MFKPADAISVRPASFTTRRSRRMSRRGEPARPPIIDYTLPKTVRGALTLIAMLDAQFKAVGEKPVAL